MKNYRELVDLYLTQNKIDKAVDALVQWGDKYVEQKQWDKARSVYKEAQQHAPGNDDIVQRLNGLERLVPINANNLDMQGFEDFNDSSEETELTDLQSISAELEEVEVLSEELAAIAARDSDIQTVEDEDVSVVDSINGISATFSEVDVLSEELEAIVKKDAELEGNDFEDNSGFEENNFGDSKLDSSVEFEEIEVSSGEFGQVDFRESDFGSLSAELEEIEDISSDGGELPSINSDISTQGTEKPYLETEDLIFNEKDQAQASGADIQQAWDFTSDIRAFSHRVVNIRERKLIGIVVGIVAAALGFVIFLKSIDVPQVTVHQVKAVKLQQAKEFPGMLQPQKSLSVPISQPGTVEEITSETIVQKSDFLARLRTQRKASQHMQEQLLSLQNEIQQLGLQKNTVLSYQKSISYVRKSYAYYKRATRAYKKALATYKKNKSKQNRALAIKTKNSYRKNKSRYAKYRKQYAQYKKQYAQILQIYADQLPKKSSTALLSLLQQKIQQQQKQLAEWKNDLQNAPAAEQVTIQAPESGIIKEWSVRKQQEITSTPQTLCKLDVTSTMQVQFTIDHPQAPEWKEGKTARLRYHGLELSGTIASVHRNNQKPPQLIIKVQVPNADNQLMVGNEISLIHQQQYQSLTVPLQAIIKRDGKHFVIVVNKEKVYQRRIELGQKTGNMVAVTGDIFAEEKIVVGSSEDLHNLKHEQQVTIAEPQ